MARLWLPTQYTIKEPTTGREQVLIIPGAESMDRGQLEEITQWQEETTKAKLKAMGPKVKPRYSRKETGQAINEYLQSLRRRQKTGNPKYY